MRDCPEADDSEEFSLVLGGPLYQLLLRTRLARPHLDLLQRRVVAITLVAWLPLLVLSALEGRAFGLVGIPFLKDLDAQVRLLVALPLLILAEKIIHERLRADTVARGPLVRLDQPADLPVHPVPLVVPAHPLVPLPVSRVPPGPRSV